LRDHPNSFFDPPHRRQKGLILKNPFMSMWLSAANRAAATGRGIGAAALRRQQTAILNETTKAITSFWTMKPKTKARKRKKST